MSWNQWAVAPPVPPTPVPASNPMPPLIGTYSAAAAPPAIPAVPPANPAFNYAAMTPEQQYAIQQNWQQWQAYQQQYAQWHAQYGDQYQREMQAKLGSAAPQLPYSGANTTLQPPATSTVTAYNQTIPPPLTAPTSFMNVPPPPPEQEKFVQGNAARPPPPPQDPNVIKPFEFKSSNDSNCLQGKNDDSRNTYFENDHSFNKNNNSDRYSNTNQNKRGNNSSYDRKSDYRNQEHRNFDNQSQQYGRHLENHSQTKIFDKPHVESNQVDNVNPGEKSREEILFDEQFKKWEEEFENWKRANVNHPDRKAYREYEMKFEECRRKLVERREQMRKRKLDQTQKSVLPQAINTNVQSQDNIFTHEEIKNEQTKSTFNHQQQKENICAETKIEKEEIKIEDGIKDAGNEINDDISEEKSNETDFLTPSNLSGGIPGLNLSGGIPGLDLVRDDDKKVQKSKDVPEEVVEIIDLEKQNNESLFKKNEWENDFKNVSSVQDKTPWMSQKNDTQTKKIPSLFDINIEKPNFSPPRNSFSSEKDFTESNRNAPNAIENKSTSQQSPSNISSCPLPDNITKALQDPGVLAILSCALKTNTFDTTNNNKPSNSTFGNEHLNVENSDFRYDRNYQKNIWDDQDNRRQDQLQRPDMNLPQFGNEFSNNMNQRNRFDDPEMHWQNFDRNDNRGPNYFNNERNRDGGYGNRRFNDNDNNDNSYRDNDNNRGGFNPFKRDNDQNRGDNDDRQRNMDISENQNRGREKDRDNRNENNQNNNRNRRNRNNRSRSNNKNNNRFDNNSKDNDQFNSNEKPSGSSFNPFRRGEGSNTSFGNNNIQNQPESDEYFKPTQVIDYQNKPLKSNENDIFPLAKVVDYGHKRSGNNSKEIPKPNDDYFPMKTIDYGHASSKRADNNKPRENKIDNNNPIENAASSSSLGGGFGDFLASKTMGSGNNNKVEDLKYRVYNDSWNTFPNSESQEKSDHISSTAMRGNQFNQLEFKNLNSKQGIFSKNTSMNNVDTNRNFPQNKFENDKFENNNKKIIVKSSFTDANQRKSNFDQISDDDDEKCFSEIKYDANSTAATSTTTTTSIATINNSTSFSNYISTISTIKEPNIFNKSTFNMLAPPPPPLISTKMFELSSSLINNRPTYSYNHNLTLSNNNIPCPNPLSTTSIIGNNDNNDKQLIFPSMENHNTITIDELLLTPGRDSRPKKLVIIMRGPPGSGKSYLAKLIKEKEIEMKGSQPRILSIDDYFMNEVEKEERCPKTSRKIFTKDLVYEYDKEMEPNYIECLLKSYKKTLSEGLFNFIIVDSHNHSLRTFIEFYNIAKAEGFTPYTIDLICDIEKCLKNNIHKRSRHEIENIIKSWKETPEHYIKLNIDNLYGENTEINEVEMEDAFIATGDLESEENSQQSANYISDSENDDENSNNENFMSIPKSKWDVDATEERLARLDGTSKKLNKHSTLEDYLQMDGWEPPTSSSKNKRRVRWADIEEKREQDKMRAIGFVVGHTDWNRMMDPTGGSAALTKTKYIERINKSALKKK